MEHVMDNDMKNWITCRFKGARARERKAQDETRQDPDSA